MSLKYYPHLICWIMCCLVKVLVSSLLLFRFHQMFSIFFLCLFLSQSRFYCSNFSDSNPSHVFPALGFKFSCFIEKGNIEEKKTKTCQYFVSVISVLTFKSCTFSPLLLSMYSCLQVWHICAHGEVAVKKLVIAFIMQIFLADYIQHFWLKTVPALG